MLEVREETADRIFRAQSPEVRGQLRLDISSRTYPPDLNKPVDLSLARQAIGERVVDMARRCASDAIQLHGRREGFESGAIPPEPDASGRLLLMRDARHFERFVLYRLNKILGTDPRSDSYEDAMTNLAEDFYQWAEEQKEDFEIAQERLLIRCKALPQYPGLSQAGPGLRTLDL